MFILFRFGRGEVRKFDFVKACRGVISVLRGKLVYPHMVVNTGPLHTCQPLSGTLVAKSNNITFFLYILLSN